MPRRGLRDDGIALRLDPRNHLQHQFQALQFADDLGLPVGSSGLIIIDALGCAQTFDAVDVLDPLLDQPVTLAMQPPGIFLLDARNPHHAACIRLAAQITAKCPQHPLDVNPIGLGAPRPPVHQQARRIENMITHPMSFEPAVQPEPVIAGLVARHHLDRSAQLSANLLANPFDQLEQAIGSSCCSMGSAHPPPNWPCSIQLQSGSGQGHHCGRSTWCLPNGLPSVSPMQGWWWFVYTALVPPRWPCLHRILTRGSIFFAQGWIAGPSPAMTLDEYQQNPLYRRRAPIRSYSLSI